MMFRLCGIVQAIGSIRLPPRDRASAISVLPGRCRVHQRIELCGSNPRGAPGRNCPWIRFEEDKQMNQAITGLVSIRARHGGGAQLGLRLTELQLRTQRDANCLGCELLPGQPDEDCWLLRSHWHSEEALQAHLSLPHMQLLGRWIDSGLIRHLVLQVEHLPA